MRVLLCTIGSRGDVQPLVALAAAVRASGHDVHLVVPPDFREWIETLGMAVTPIGPEVRPTGRAAPSAVPTAEQRRQMVQGTIDAQFETIGAAARGCDVIVAATALQVAARSVAERLGIRYVFAAYCPAVLPSTQHAPPVYTTRGDSPIAAPAEYAALWAQNAARFNESFRDGLNAARAAIGLAPIDDVRSHVFTDRPWLAADPVLAPWPEPTDARVFQTGAWVLDDDGALSPELESFLAAGDPPVYFGFGSVRAPQDLARAMIESARALGHRAIVSRGWAELTLVDEGADCLAIGEVNHQALFGRVAAVVHHGGAGTTTAAALAGVPQVVIPQVYDQHYFAQRVAALGIGIAHAPVAPTMESLAAALGGALQPEVAVRARSIAARMSRDGALIAARRVVYERAL
jgi:vancomycin aglycone glucosyltransferase